MKSGPTNTTAKRLKVPEKNKENITYLKYYKSGSFRYNGGGVHCTATAVESNSEEMTPVPCVCMR